MAKPAANCDMCGKQENLVHAIIEGVDMNVCRACAGFGKIIVPPTGFSRNYPSRFAKPVEPVIIESVMDDYAFKIKTAREKRKLNQEEFARMLSERESTLTSIEAGKQRPTMELAKKLEKLLSIQLIETIKEEPVQKEELRKKGPLTIGDMLQMKK
jgi:putative transcription factor